MTDADRRALRDPRVRKLLERRGVDVGALEKAKPPEPRPGLCPVCRGRLNTFNGRCARRCDSRQARGSQ